MKNHLCTSFLVFIFSTAFTCVFSQDEAFQYSRSWDKKGINVFEPSKSDDQPEFKKLHYKFGASFTQDYQNLKHSNTPVYAQEFRDPVVVNKNLLYGTTSSDSTSATLAGFNTAMANLNLDVQLADGIRMCVESYMSSRHHNEFWVKGGYIQVDRLPMLGNPDWFKKYVRLKVGHFAPNYGDMQLRRTDGGNTMYNPFVENYILDAFTTEIGGEAYVFPMKGLMLMLGVTGGTLEGNIDVPEAKPAPFTADKTDRKASIYGKIAFDNKVDKLRYRISGSFYNNNGSPNQTLYYGDRAGSHYFMVMEQNRSEIFVEGKSQGFGQSSYINNKDSGRFNPLFTSNVSSLMFNAFLKYLGLEFFGTYESAKGSAKDKIHIPFSPDPDPVDRKFSQYAAELLYRFGKEEQFCLGARYNSLTGRALFGQSDFMINRIAAVASWLPLDNLMIKAEYVDQQYKDFAPGFNSQYNGKFSGMVLEACVSF